MRRLLLLRHAKAARPDGVADIDRPLSRRGQKDAPLLGAVLAEAKPQPDLVLVSPARRARETWELARPALGAVAERNEPRIYEAGAERLLTLLRAIAPSVTAVLLVGHNPGLEDLARLLVREGEADAVAELRRGMATAALALIDVELDDWARLKPLSGHLAGLVTPRSLGARDQD